MPIDLPQQRNLFLSLYYKKNYKYMLIRETRNDFAYNHVQLQQVSSNPS